MNIIFFDTETTGLPKNYKAPATDVENWPRIVELSWTVCTEDGRIVKQESFVIRPEGFEIPEAASAIHGISQEYAMTEGVSIKTALEAFTDDYDGCELVVAHNLNYDLNVISCEHVRSFGFEITEKAAVCTMKASTEFCAIPSKRGFKYPSLQELHTTLFGYKFDNEHSATADTEAAQRCYFALRKNGVIAS
ncbi:MAG: 3'-5' exonuclease [Chlorobi bacterium]|nr:3'-5' exonuclease [Chlorobiota bacterium]